MSEWKDLDAHDKAPDVVKAWYKRWQRMESSAFNASSGVIDCRNDPGESQMLREVIESRFHDASKILREFMGGDIGVDDHHTTPRVFEVNSLPGLLVYPSILPEPLQLGLLDKLLHRDLSDPQHQTNVHLHYDVPYCPPQPHTEGHSLSFFDPAAQSLTIKPKTSHGALDVPRMLDKKLRWMTLGGQYDWTAKTYPPTPPPPFPEDVKNLVEGLFPMEAEAAIVNLYSPGDTLSVHRDVSEACAQPLVSISLGCEAIFLVALADDAASSASDVDSAATTSNKDGINGPGNLRSAVIRLRSGDAVLMSGSARYAWHGVPRVIADTCPGFMRSWPAATAGASEGGVGNRYEGYRGWMAGKRVNLNVRQMFADIAVEVEGQ
ncbi:hypothetical protein LTR35_010043 [Friedmanniomyces endolithicus]|uniref:Fe2OG dioxygenase domain-containing protein n=2 Tax=Friedmanniomyces endolithicus TaxID=329885 RepID=A0AAN6FV18_9PEZI|nr:hypothetical protein LTS09_016505 [Friedmanniomyces endolithicus]KAK0277133.1 hypothetical protein LTR35_010043 [Friedmanniomyces endolithicus]KAK0298261.1 hypothetical protein LTS00_003226 [Friedmanniomyces endolithicus]KAK0313683.1 hypothetical protein LTR01_001940 [Friedmanniomyces endolithicus]KAK0323858.1 hypothetical protein LTR82_004978 [Friedmanniomyces endolithicus]